MKHVVTEVNNKHLVVASCWFFLSLSSQVSGSFFVSVCRLSHFVYFTLSFSQHIQTLTYVTVSGSFCMRLTDDGDDDDDVFAESVSSSVTGHRPCSSWVRTWQVSQIRGFARRMRIKKNAEISRTF